MIRALLTRLGWPDFSRPAPTSQAFIDLEAKVKARQQAQAARQDARRRRQADAAYRAHINATAAELAAQQGKEWPA